MAGRTTWYASDEALLRRELWVEVAEEFGPAGLIVLVAINGRACAQRAGGVVRDGFRSLARETFTDAREVRRVVEFASSIGHLDDLEIDEDGRRFECRISGWSKDQEKGRAAWRKAAERDRTDRDVPSPTVTSHGDDRSVTPSTPHNNTEQNSVVVVDAHASANAPSLSVLTDLTDVAINALTQAGYDRDLCVADEPAIRQVCVDKHAGVDTDWSQVARRVREARPKLKHDTPGTALRWVAAGGLPVIGQAPRLPRNAVERAPSQALKDKYGEIA